MVAFNRMPLPYCEYFTTQNTSRTPTQGTNDILKRVNLSIKPLDILKFALNNHIKKTIFLQKVFIFVQLFCLIEPILAGKLRRATSFAKYENRNIYINYRVSITVKSIKPCHASLKSTARRILKKVVKSPQLRITMPNSKKTMIFEH